MKDRTLQYRIMMILFALLFLFFLCGDFAIPATFETAIITAVGVENGENGEFLMTFVLAQMQNDTRENITVQTSSTTVAGGVKQLESKFGLTPKLAYTSLVLVEKDLAQNGIFDVISFFLNTNGVHDSATLMVCENSPKDIFDCDIPTEKTGYDALVKALKKAESTPFALPKTNLKDYAETYFSGGKDPMLATVELKDINGEKHIDIGGGYLFSGDEIALRVKNFQTLAVNILKNKAKNASFTIEDVEIFDNKTDIRLAIVSCDCKIKQEITIKTPNITVNCKVKVGLIDQSNSSKTLAQITGTATDKTAIENAVSDYITKNITTLLESSCAQNADFLGIGEKLARKEKNQLETLKNANITASTTVEVLQNYRI